MKYEVKITHTNQHGKVSPIYEYHVLVNSADDIRGIHIKAPDETGMLDVFIATPDATEPESPEVDFVVQGTSSSYDNLLNKSVAPIEAISRIEADELKDRLCRDLTALVAMAFYEGMKDSNAPRPELKAFDYKIAVRKLVCSGCLIPSDDFVNYGTALMVKYYKTGVTYANEKVQED